MKYVIPYKGSMTMNIIYNLLSAIFALLSYTVIVPFLKVLFNTMDTISDPGTFQPNIDYLSDWLLYRLCLFIGNQGQLAALVIVCLVFVLASMLKNGFIFLSNNCMASIRSWTIRDIRHKLFAKILSLPTSYFTDARKGDIMTRISNDVQEIEISVISSLTMMFRDPITVIIFMVYLCLTSWQLTLFALLLLPVSLLLIGKLSRNLKSKAFVGQQQLGSVLSIVEESLSGVKIIQGFNAEKKMQNRFDELNEHYSKIFRRVLRKNYLGSPLTEFLASAVVMVLVYMGGKLALEGTTSLSPDTLIAFVIVFSQIIHPLKQISTGWFNIQKGVASIERVEAILNAKNDIVDKPNAQHITEFSDRIEFRNIWFAYNNEPVLKEINLTIKKGQTIAIVGKSGAGKSTLSDMLPRFIDPDKGEILIDGCDIRNLRIADIRSLMGIVSQTPILFNTSFADNIAFGLNRTPSEEEIVNAAKIANADIFICESEEGYNTLVGEAGSKLSGGQRQRISIARAILANPPILILDEATSALDTESERLVQDAIYKLMKNRTSIVIAHRLSTIQNADTIVVMDEGRIVELGTHDELIKIPNGHYAKLHSFQSI